MSVPMPPVVTDFVKKNLVARIGPLATVVLLSGIVFAIGFMLDWTYFDSNSSDILGGENVVYALLLAVVAAVGYFVVGYLLSVAFPAFQFTKVLALVVIFAVAAFIGVLLDGEFTGLLDNDEKLIEWIVRLLQAGLLAYVLSEMNQFIPSAGEPRTNRNMTLLVFVGWTAISAAVLDLRTTFFGTDTWLGGLLAGFIFGVALGGLLYLALAESGGAGGAAGEAAKKETPPAEE